MLISLNAVKKHISVKNEINENIETDLKTKCSKIHDDSELIFEIVKDMIESLFVLTTDSKILTINKATSILLGYKEHELIGKPAKFIFAKDQSALFKESEFANLICNKSENNIESMYLTKNGKVIPILLTYTVAYKADGEPDKIIFLAENITEQKQTEIELENFRNNFSSMVESQLVELSNINENLKLEINERESAESELNEYKNHLEKLVEERTSELNDANKKLKKEIAERKLREEDIKVKNVQLIQSSKLASIGELAAGISHETNQPLQAISILNASLKKKLNKLDFKSINSVKGATKSDFLQINQRILFSIERMKKIIQHVKSFSRIDNENKMFHEIDINEVVKNSLILTSQQLKNNDIELHLNLQNELPFISGNSQQLEQVSINMISNAKDAIGEEIGSVKIRLYIEDEKLFVQWINSGPKISSKIIGSIFDPFFTTKDESKGTGLGLSISYGIITDHKGDLQVESSDEKTVFTASIPILGKK